MELTKMQEDLTLKISVNFHSDFWQQVPESNNPERKDQCTTHFCT